MQIQSLSSSIPSGVPVQQEVAPRGQAVAAETSQIAASVAVSAGAVQAAKPAPTSSEVKGALEKLNKTVSSMNDSLQFSVDSDTKMNVVKLIDRNTNEVIRQIPTEEVLHIAKAIDSLQGMLIKDKA